MTMRNQMTIKTYSELIKLETIQERFDYFCMHGKVGEDNLGCDLGVKGFDIIDQKIIIHHMNPITKEDILNHSKFLLDPEYLITTVDCTHKAIHYGNRDLLYQVPITRTKYDTCPWRH